MTPYYDQDGIRIYHGDCREVLPQLNEKFDLCLTDPPYGVNKAEWDNAYPRWVVDTAFAVATCVGVMPGLWALPDCVQDFNGRYKWVLSGYNRNGMTHGAIGYNNWIPCVVGGEVKIGGQDAMMFTVGSEPKFNHPSQKPYPYIAWLIERLSESGNSILDPFMGSGTTLVAAKQLGRRAVGIEIEEKYCEIAVKRLAQMELF